MRILKKLGLKYFLKILEDSINKSKGLFVDIPPATNSEIIKL
jgi:hypothetical protein